MSSDADKMMTLFAGFERAYGTYTSEEPNMAKGGKLEIKKSAKTVREPVTLDLWRKHLSGEAPLGIIPSDSKNRVRWACIDVDRYDISHADLVEKIEKRKLPLTVCRTKSGGAHIFAFFQEWVHARDAQHVMRGVAASLGFGNSEIFPKQVEVLLDRGDMGSWLNMPYFDAKNTMRTGVKKNGLSMTPDEFFTAAFARRCTVDQLSQEEDDDEDSRGSESAGFNSEFKDGPPCLQHLTRLGFPEGTRNNGLTALAIFAKKKYESDWEAKLETWNQEFMDPPLSTEEVTNVIKSMRRKEYRYKCKDQPICSHCNSQICVTRRFGVGDDGNFPTITGLSVMNTDPPLWFMDVSGTRLELTTDELQNYRRFQKICMERLYVVYPMLKQETWNNILKDAMQGVTMLEAPPEVGIIGAFFELFRDFLADRLSVEDKETVILGRVWHDEEKGRMYFRLRDLQDHLLRHKFDSYGRGQITTRIKDVGGNSDFFNIKGVGVNVWYVPASFAKAPEGPSLPILKGEVM